MANNPRVPCVMEGARRPDRMDDKTGAQFTPEGISIAVGDVMLMCGTPGPGPGPGPGPRHGPGSGSWT